MRGPLPWVKGLYFIPRTLMGLICVFFVSGFFLNHWMQFGEWILEKKQGCLSGHEAGAAARYDGGLN